MAQIVRKADIEAAACHHQKGETDDDTPDNDVYQGFDAAAAWVRELLFHHDTKIAKLAHIRMDFARIMQTIGIKGRYVGFTYIRPLYGFDLFWRS